MVNMHSILPLHHSSHGRDTGENRNAQGVQGSNGATPAYPQSHPGESTSPHATTAPTAPTAPAPSYEPPPVITSPPSRRARFLPHISLSLSSFRIPINPLTPRANASREQGHGHSNSNTSSETTNDPILPAYSASPRPPPPAHISIPRTSTVETTRTSRTSHTSHTSSSLGDSITNQKAKPRFFQPIITIAQTHPKQLTYVCVMSMAALGVLAGWVVFIVENPIQTGMAGPNRTGVLVSNGLFILT